MMKKLVGAAALMASLSATAFATPVFLYEKIDGTLSDGTKVSGTFQVATGSGYTGDPVNFNKPPLTVQGPVFDAKTMAGKTANGEPISAFDYIPSNSRIVMTGLRDGIEISDPTLITSTTVRRLDVTVSTTVAKPLTTIPTSGTAVYNISTQTDFVNVTNFSGECDRAPSAPNPLCGTKTNDYERWFTGGTITVSTTPFNVPEAGTLALLGAGLVGITLVRRRMVG